MEDANKRAAKLGVLGVLGVLGSWQRIAQQYSTFEFSIHSGQLSNLPKFRSIAEAGTKVLGKNGSDQSVHYPIADLVLL